MNDSPESERLLADILEEERHTGLRQGLLNQTLNAVRRRRRFRQTRLAVSAASNIEPARLPGLEESFLEGHAAALRSAWKRVTGYLERSETCGDLKAQYREP